jgi:hypothetical protein
MMLINIPTNPDAFIDVQMVEDDLMYEIANNPSHPLRLYVSIQLAKVHDPLFGLEESFFALVDVSLAIQSLEN